MTAAQRFHIRLTPFLMTFIGLNIVAAFYFLFTSYELSGDDFEHLRAAWFVSNGELPYRDFFEHHHPLLWFVLAPLLKILPQDTETAFFCGRCLSFLLSLGTGCYLFKTVQKFLGGKQAALVCLCLYLATLMAWPGMFNIKPDIYMRFCYFAGLYHLFCYFREQRVKDIILCGIFFCIGFLFLQIIIFYVLPLLVPTAYFLYKHPHKYIDFLKAAVVPLLILGSVLYFLFYTRTWEIYFQQNWLLNRVLAKFIGGHPSNFFIFFDFFIIALICLFPKKTSKISLYSFTLFCLFLTELLRVTVASNVSVHYFVMLFIFYAMFFASYLTRFIRPQAYSCIFLGFLMLHFLLNVLYSLYHPLSTSPYFYFDAQKIKTDSQFGLFANIYAPRLSYYWSYQHMSALDNLLFNRIPAYNLSALLSSHRIEYLLNATEGSSTLFILRSTLNLTHEQMTFVRKHFLLKKDIKKDYEFISDDLYKRKEGH